MTGIPSPENDHSSLGESIIYDNGLSIYEDMTMYNDAPFTHPTPPLPPPPPSRNQETSTQYPECSDYYEDLECSDYEDPVRLLQSSSRSRRPPESIEMVRFKNSSKLHFNCLFRA